MANQIPLIVNAGAAQIQELATADNLEISANVVTGGILTDGYYYANGTPVTFGGNIDFTQVTTDIIPTGNNTQSLGNATNQWQDIYVSNATIYFDSVPLTVDGSGALTFDGNSLVQSGPNVINTGNVETTGNIVGANVEANYFLGDGSNLTGILSGVAVSQWANGNVLSNTVSNVENIWFDSTTGFSVTNITGNTALISLGSSFKTWEVAGQANLVAVGEDTVEFVAGNNIVITTDANAIPQQIEFAVSSNITATSVSVTGNVTANIFNLANAGNLTYSSVRQNQNPPYGSQAFGIELLTTTDDANVFSSVAAGPDYVSLKSTNAGNANVVVQGGYGVTISTSNATGGAIKNWTFTSAGNALFPGALSTALDISTTGNILSDNVLTSNIISAGGNVTANYFIGNGSALTGIVSTYSNTNVQSYLEVLTSNISTTGNIQAGGNVTAGNFSTAGNILGGGNFSVTGNAQASNFDTAGNILGTGTFSVTGNAVAGNFTTAGNVSASGNITGNYFIGDGSQLTNLPGGGLPIANGTSNIDIATANGNPTVTSAGNTWTFGGPQPDALYWPDGSFQATAFVGQALDLINTGNASITSNSTGNTTYVWTFEDDGRLTFPGTPRIATDSNNFEVQAAESINFEANDVVSIYTDTSGNAYQWIFGNDGLLTFPYNLVIAGNTNVFGLDSALIAPAPGQPFTTLSSGANGAVNSVWVEDIGNVGASNIAAVYVNPVPGSGIVRIAVGQNGGGGPNLWDFGYNGNLTAPGNINLGNAALQSFGANYVLTANSQNYDTAVSMTDGGGVNLISANVGVQITSGTDVWTFNTDGSLSFPDSTVQTTAYTGAGGGNTDWANIGNINNANGPSQISIGTNAGNSGQLGNAIAIGLDAGSNTQGVYSVAVGALAGQSNQLGYGVAIGLQAGQSTQGIGAIAIGGQAGGADQGGHAVAIGQGAGLTSQGNSAVAIGFSAGYNLQGSNSIAIGTNAGFGITTNAQANNTIILNATGNELNGVSGQANSFYVAPVRNDTGNTANALYYNTSTFEISYGPAAGGSGNSIVNGTSNVSIPTANSNVTIGANTSSWTFDTTGNLTLPANTFAVNYANGDPVTFSGGIGNIGNVTFNDITIQGTGDEYGDSGLYLAPGPNSTANLQYLRVRGGDVATHIHLDTGNNEYYDQYFGNDGKFVKLEAGDFGNVVIGTIDIGNNYNWSFTTDGNLILANGNGVIQSIANSSLDPVNPNVSTMVLTPDQGYSSQSLVLDPTAPGHIHLRAYAFSNIDQPTANLFLGGEDSSFEVGYYNGAAPNLFIHSGGNTWTFDTTGDLTTPGNITAVGNVTGNYFIGDGSQLTDLPVQPGTYGNSNVATFLGDFGSNAISTSGNITGNYFIGDGSQLTNITGANVSGNVANANSAGVAYTAYSVDGANVSGNVANANSAGVAYTAYSVDGANVSGNVANATYATTSGSATTAGTVTTNAQSNITSVGTLTSLTVTGDTTSGNVLTGGFISATGNITGNYFIGNGSQLTGISANAVNTDWANIGNINNANGPTQIAIGTDAGSNTQGEYSVAVGRFAGANVQGTQAVAVGQSAGYDTQGDYSVAVGPGAGFESQGGSAVAVGLSAGYTGQGESAVAIGQESGQISQGFGAVAVGLGAGANNQGDAAVAIGVNSGLNSQGVYSVAVGYGAGENAQGNNSIILNATGANLNQTVANTFTVAPVRNDNSNIAEVVFYNTASKEITYGNTISVAGNVTGNYFIGDGSQLTNLPAGNYSNSNVATFLGAFGSNAISTSGNITGNYFIGNGSQLTNLPAPAVTQDITSNGYMSIMLYDGNIKYNNYATVEPSSGNISGGNISGTGNITGNYFIGDGSALTNLPVQPGTYGNSNVATFLGAFGSNAISTSGNITGNYFIGNGLLLTSITGANVTGNVANANSAGVAYTAYSVDGANVSGNVANANSAGIAYTAYSVDGANVSGTVANATSAITAGTVTDNAQPNITSVGTLTSLSVTGNTTSGNLLTAGIVSATGNITTAGYFVGTFAGNISGNLTVPGANTQVIYNNNGNADASAGFTFNAATNAMSVSGNTNSGNILTTGIVSATGNVSANYVIGNGSLLTSLTGANVTGTVANATYATSAGTATSATTAETVTTNAQPNITSTGTLTSLTASGLISTTGNVSANYVIGNGSLLTSLTGENVTGTVANATFATSAGSAVGTAATITTNAQPNITSVGTLTSLTVTGNTTSGNLLTGGFVSATGNVTGNYIIGDGSLLTNVNASNITGAYNNTNVSSFLAAFGSNTISTSGTINSGNITGANITTNGTLSVGGIVMSGNLIVGAGPTLTIDPNGSGGTDGNVVITGNLTVQGTTTTINSNTVTTNDLQINMANNAANATAANNGGIGVGPIGSEYATLLYNTAANVWVASLGISSVGNVSANNLSANTVTGTLSTAAQNNITSVGTLTSLTVTGDTTSGNLLTGGLISALGNVTGNYFIGDGSQLTNLPVQPGTYSNSNVATFLGDFGSNAISTSGNITGNYIIGNGVLLTSLTGSNVTGTVANATYALSAGNAVGTAATVTTNAQSNITSVGTLTSLSVSGTLTAGQFSGNGNTISNITGANVSGTVATATTAGTVTTNAQANITSVGTLTSLNVTGNVTGGNLSGTNLTGSLTTAAQANITSVGTLTSLNVTGDTTSGNLLTGGLISATGNATVGNLSVTGNITGNTAGFAIGYLNIPQVSWSANATIGLTDAGKHYYTTSASNLTLTIANSATANFSVGSAINFINTGTGTMSILQGSGVTLYLAGNNLSGNRTVSTFGAGTLQKVDTDTWFLVGIGLT